MRVIVTGPRNWDAKTKARNVFGSLAAEVGYENLTIVHGHCPTGIDEIANDWCKALGVNCEAYKAEWDRFGKRAGPLRNQDMVDKGADLCLAFIAPCTKYNCKFPRPHNTHGTADCVQRCEKAGIEIRRFYLYGKA